MTDVTSTYCTFRRTLPGIMTTVTCTAAVNNGDTFTMTLKDYGWSKILCVDGYIQTTADSVVVAEAPTTSVTTGVLTVTVGGSTGTKQRVFHVWGLE